MISAPAFFRIFPLAALTLAAGCGTIQRGASEDVEIKVTPAFAEIATSRGHRCTGSCTLKVPRTEAFIVNAAAPGYYPQRVRVESTLSLAGTRSVASNVAGPAFVGVGVDIYTGAGRDHTPNPVVIELKPRPASAGGEPPAS